MMVSAFTQSPIIVALWRLHAPANVFVLKWYLKHVFAEKYLHTIYWTSFLTNNDIKQQGTLALLLQGGDAQ